MPSRFTPKVVTANNLCTGEVVYLTADDRWSGQFREAELLEDEADADIRLIFASQQVQRVVGVYLAEARAGRSGPEPGHVREKVRATGPSNYSHGKQAERV